MHRSSSAAVVITRLTPEGAGDGALAQSISTARVDMNPHQVDAALFALALISEGHSELGTQDDSRKRCRRQRPNASRSLRQFWSGSTHRPSLI